MLRHTVPIGRIFGISIDLDYSWFLIIVLLSWVLAVSYYPAEFRNWSALECWLMGIITAIALFASVLVHELGHSVVAKRFGLPVPRITLFLFGGVSQIAGEPTSAASEFWVAVVGPVVSFALAAFFWEIEPLLSWSQPLYALAKYLAILNLVLGLFNLIPGFPLDGGRVLRALLWRITADYRGATAAAAVTGRLFGFALIFLGVWQALKGNLVGGLWTAFIGWFLESAAASELQQEVVKNLLGGHKVLNAMRRDFAQVSGEVTLQELVDRYVMTAGIRCFVVNRADNAPGIVTLGAIRGTPSSSWPTTKASQVMVPIQKLATTQPNVALWSALDKMGRDGVSQLPVVEGSGIIGILSREDVLQYLRVLQEFAH